MKKRYYFLAVALLVIALDHYCFNSEAGASPLLVAEFFSVYDENGNRVDEFYHARQRGEMGGPGGCGNCLAAIIIIILVLAAFSPLLILLK